MWKGLKSLFKIKQLTIIYSYNFLQWIKMAYTGTNHHSDSQFHKIFHMENMPFKNSMKLNIIILLSTEQV